MTMALFSTAAAIAANVKVNDELKQPPPAPNLGPSAKQPLPFSVAALIPEEQRILKLTVVMPMNAQEGQTTNLAWCFKRFLTALLKLT